MRESDERVSYFRLSAQKVLSEEMAFELILEIYEGTRVNILINNESGRF